MTLPSVLITELDGALGVLPPSAGRLLAVVGVASSGPVATPATFARVTDLVATFTSGPGVEAAAHYIDMYGRPVLFTRAAAADSGAVSAVTSVPGTGTADVTVAALPVPNDDLEMVLKIVAGGTVGVAGITYQLSYDGGRSFGPTVALGTADEIQVPGAGTITIELETTETLAAGATYSFRTTAPNFDPTTLGAALEILKNTIVNWELLLVAGPIGSTGIFDAIETKFASMFNAGKYHGWIGNTRMPNAAESEATYKTALDTLFSAKATKFGSFYAGAGKMISAVSGRQYRRPVAFVTGAREQSVSEEVDIADVNTGSLPITIRDANGNADEHDESINPGLDDSRFGTLRTWDGVQGVFVTRPRLFSSEGSDFQLMPHRRVLNLAHSALRQYFIRRLNKPIRVDKTTGFILEREALEIEAGALAAMRSVLLAKPKASDVQFTLSRTDNVLSTKTLTGTARVIPLAYPEFINLEVGFYNPALITQAA